MLRKLAVAVVTRDRSSPPAAIAQDAKAVIASASKAMGADGLSSITYSGSAANGNFGQSKTIAGPLAVTTISNYTRAIDLTQPASRATGATMPPTIPGRAAAGRGNVQSEHHAGQRGMDAAARNLGDAVGFPEGCGGEQRHGSIAEDSAARPITSCPGRPRRRRRPARPIG